MKKRIVVSFVAEDNAPNFKKVSNATKRKVGQALTDLGFTNIVVFPGIDADTAQIIKIELPAYTYIPNYSNWQDDDED